MAELALSIVGVALAWKGIQDFAQLLSRLTDDDDRERNVTAIGLEASQQVLDDWGEYWGILRAERGRFHRLEPSRQTLVLKIIYQLYDSRELAVKRLRKTYGLFTEKEEMRSGAPETRLSRMVEGFIAAGKRGKKKTRWLMGDDTFIAKLVEETWQLHGYLDRLTSMSMKFLVANLDAFRENNSLEFGLNGMEQQVKKYVQEHIRNAGQIDVAKTPQNDDTIDDQTLAGYATDSVMSSRQREQILKHIDASLHRHDDSRVPETIAAWWNDSHSELLVLELPDFTENEAATPACVLLYYLVECHKLIFIFDAYSSKQPIQQLLDMIRTFICSLISIRGNKPLEELRLPISISKMETGTIDTATMQELIKSFLDLLRDVLESSDKRILLIVDRLEHSGLEKEDSTSQLIRLVVSGLNEICESTDGVDGGTFKALLAHKGHATSLYDCVADENVVGLTDRAPQVTSLREELASSLHDYMQAAKC
jgi:hypothetical protein